MASKLTVRDNTLWYNDKTALGTVIKGDDGYYSWWPDNTRGGCLDAWFLRELADLLDEMNQEWDAEITEYFRADQALRDAANYQHDFTDEVPF